MQTRFRAKTFRDQKQTEWKFELTTTLGICSQSSRMQTKRLRQKRCGDPGADRDIQRSGSRDIQRSGSRQTFRDPGADRDIQRSRSRQRHSETQEQTVTFRDPEADRNIQRSRCGQHGG